MYIALASLALALVYFGIMWYLHNHFEHGAYPLIWKGLKGDTELSWNTKMIGYEIFRRRKIRRPVRWLISHYFLFRRMYYHY
jgi:hypothetical protein